MKGVRISWLFLLISSIHCVLMKLVSFQKQVFLQQYVENESRRNEFERCRAKTARNQINMYKRLGKGVCRLLPFLLARRHDTIFTWNMTSECLFCFISFLFKAVLSDGSHVSCIFIYTNLCWITVCKPVITSSKIGFQSQLTSTKKT